MAVTNSERKLGQRETLRFDFRSKQQTAGTGTGEDSECRPKPGHAIALQWLVDRTWPVEIGLSSLPVAKR
jgi:hypothetical protein